MTVDQQCCDRFVVRVRQEFLDVAEDVGVTEIMAFATSAIREAANGEAVIAEVEAAHRRAASGSRVATTRARLTFPRCSPLVWGAVAGSWC